MSDFSYTDLMSVLNSNSIVNRLDNASDIISKYGDNIVFLSTCNSDIERKRYLSPIAVRENRLSQYKYGLINDKLEIVVKPIYDSIVDDVFDAFQLIRVGITTPVIYGDNSNAAATIHLRQRFGVIDSTGKTILENKYDYISFQNNYKNIIVINGLTSLIQGAGMFSNTGDVIIPIGKVRKIFDFHNGMGLARFISNNNKWGILSEDGTIMLPAIYDKIWKIEGNNFDSAIVEKEHTQFQIPFSEILQGKFLHEPDSDDDLPF